MKNKYVDDRSIFFSKQNPESKRKNVIFDSSILLFRFATILKSDNDLRSTSCQAFLICDSLNFFFFFTFFFLRNTTRCKIIKKEETRINFFFRISHRCRSLNRFRVFINFFFFLFFSVFYFFFFFDDIETPETMCSPILMGVLVVPII